MTLISRSIATATAPFSGGAAKRNSSAVADRTRPHPLLVGRVYERRPNRGRAWATALVMLGAVTAPATDDVDAAGPDIPPDARSENAGSTALPHVLDGDVADVIVRVRGGGVCSGTPITNTRYVVTAAHCVLDRAGDVGSRTVVRDGVSYRAVAVLVDTRYHEHPSARLDAAVLVLDQPIAGPSARLGSVLPTQGMLTLVGYQPIDSDGTLLRGDSPHDTPLPKNATGTLIEIGSAPAGCNEPAAALDTTPTRVTAPCGLIPGSSGGALLARTGDQLVLVGIISTVAADLSANGIVPLASLHELVQHPDTYFHDLARDNGHVARAGSIRSGGTLS